MRTGSGIGDSERSEGFFAALKRLLADLLGIAHTRLELFSNELQEEKLRLISLLIYAGGALVAFAIGLVSFLCLLVVLLWDHRILLFASLCMGFLVVAGALAWLAVCQVKRRSRLFAASLAELGEDLRQLRAGRSSTGGNADVDIEG